MWELGGNTSHTVLLRGQHPQPPAGTCTHIPEMFLQLPPLHLCAAFNIRPGRVEPDCCHIFSDFPFFFFKALSFQTIIFWLMVLQTFIGAIEVA